MLINDLIFREYDIRGIVGTHFDESFAYYLAQGYAKLLKETFPQNDKLKISIGRDARLSSSSLAQSLITGLLDAGIDVYDLGLVTTPICYFSVFYKNDLNGAIMVTGSHNPPEYNGFKISVGKQTIFSDKIQYLKKLVYESVNRGPLESRIKGVLHSWNIIPEYIAYYQKQFPRMEGLKVVLDCGNGASGVVARGLYEAVGIQVEVLFEQPDGRFPNHHPDPTVEENLVFLKKKVIEVQAHVGIGFDGDADRIGVVDDQGQYWLGDQLLMVLARDVLEKQPGAKIIADVKCSDQLFQDIANQGGIPIMWKTGHSLVKEKIKIEKAPLGGELSGHIFFNDRNFGYDDALYAGLRLCEILHRQKRPLSQTLTGLKPSYSTPEVRIDTTEELKKTIVENLIQEFQKLSYPLNLIDGVRISFPDGWALIRSSNTQPVIVVRIEAYSIEAFSKITTLLLDKLKPYPVNTQELEKQLHRWS